MEGQKYTLAKKEDDSNIFYPNVDKKGNVDASKLTFEQIKDINSAGTFHEGTIDSNGQYVPGDAIESFDEATLNDNATQYVFNNNGELWLIEKSLTGGKRRTSKKMSRSCFGGKRSKSKRSKKNHGGKRNKSRRSKK